MRTTLDIDDDVLRAVRELARREKKTAGASDLRSRAPGAGRLACGGHEGGEDPSTDSARSRSAGAS